MLQSKVIYMFLKLQYYHAYFFTQACKDSAVQCVEYFPGTNTASNSDEGTWEEDSIESSTALFSIEIKSLTSLEKDRFDV